METVAERMRRIGALGGRATVAKYGSEYMSRIGKEGFRVTNETHGYGDAGKLIAHLVKKGRMCHSAGFPKRSSNRGVPMGEPCGRIRYADSGE